MTNTVHASMTGSDLHESKGISSASANTVYVADGAGSGTFQKITADQIAGTGNSFGSQLLHVRYELSSGSSADVLTAGTWNTRSFNTTKTNEISGATLASNQISLPAGTYFCQAVSPARNGGNGTITRSKLYNVTTTSDLLLSTSFVGPTLNAGSATDGTLITLLTGRFTLTGTTLLELRTYSSNTVNGGVVSAIASTNEVFSEILIWKTT